jgi:uncharacterized protein (TIGR03382 family)
VERSPTVLFLAVLATGGVVAAPIVLPARDAFEIRTVDGGIGISVGVAHIPGEDKGIVTPSAVGVDPNARYFPIVQLGGQDAGAIVGRIDVTNGAAYSYGLPYPYFREAGSAQAVLYFADLTKIMRLDPTGLTIVPTQNLFPIGYGQATTFGGTIRIPTLTGSSNDVGWGELSHRSDGTLGQKILDPAFAIPPGTGSPFESYSPPESGEVYAFPPDASGGNSVWYGQFGHYDAGFEDLGSIAGWPRGTLPHILTSAGHTYYFTSGSDAGSFAVYDLSPSGATPRGEFAVSVNGRVCDPTRNGCFGYPYVIADPFPGYPSGAFVVQGQAHDLASPRLFLMVRLEDLASALALEFDGATLPTGTLSAGESGGGTPDAGGAGADGGGGGGGGSGVGGSHLGRGIPVESAGSCTTVPGTTELWAVLLVAAGVLARRRRSR